MNAVKDKWTKLLTRRCVCVFAYMFVCVRVCVHVCLCACVRARARAYVQLMRNSSANSQNLDNESLMEAANQRAQVQIAQAALKSFKAVCDSGVHLIEKMPDKHSAALLESCAVCGGMIISACLFVCISLHLSICEHMC